MMSKAYLNRGYEYTPISMGYSLDSSMQAAGSKKINGGVGRLHPMVK
ncbi:MAG: hypothetical protein KIT59_08950 [Nitrosomonas sp.]|nr:hypothetical protein [Nitrosomonas sp.]